MQFLENQEDENNNLERWGILIFFVFFVLGVSYCTLQNTPYNLNKSRLEDNIKAQYQGKIIIKGLDSANRKIPYYSFKDSIKIYEDDYIMNIVSIGDSIIKKANSSKIEIHKKDTLIVIDYRDVYLYNDTLIRKRARYEK